jgi:hypothetical protein
MHELRSFHRGRLEKIIENDPILAENMLLGQNKIYEQIIINFFIKIVKLALVILNICYFLGMLWFVWAKIDLQDIQDA